jgi:MerR family transcriptional regulator, light-induced transcriptional regulator
MMSKLSDAGVGLPIATVSARTGLSEASLRAWEQRHGFPTPHRLAGGHRRYSEDDVRRIEAVLAARSQGLSLEAAIARVTGVADPTIFAALRRRRPELAPQLLTRRGMHALSRAIEDECMARGDRAHLTVAFQDAGRYRRARDARWRRISATAASTVVFADFSRTRQSADGVWEIAITGDAPLSREWSLVCDGPSSAAVLAGWERTDGLFEAVWTVDPQVVRVATEVGRALAGMEAPPETVAGVDPSAALGRAVAVANRVMTYLGA